MTPLYLSTLPTPLPLPRPSLTRVRLVNICKRAHRCQRSCAQARRMQGCWLRRFSTTQSRRHRPPRRRAPRACAPRRAATALVSSRGFVLRQGPRYERCSGFGCWQPAPPSGLCIGSSVADHCGAQLLERHANFLGRLAGGGLAGHVSTRGGSRDRKGWQLRCTVSSVCNHVI